MQLQQLARASVGAASPAPAPAPAPPEATSGRAGRAAPPVEAAASSHRSPTVAPALLARSSDRPERRLALQSSRPVAEAVARGRMPAHNRPKRLVSDAAGLWLVVPSLIRLGFREWLCERPDLLRPDAGRMLLRTIAAPSSSDPDDDPALRRFRGARPELARPRTGRAAGEAASTAGFAADAGIPLHRLVRKRGEVDGRPRRRLIVRFPLDAADIRLRRRALDVDPGWVDWLGLSVRYRYEGKGR